MWERILNIIRKEFRQTLRDPRHRALLIGPPLLQMIIFGYAVNLDVENARIAWIDRDRTPESRELREAFNGSPYFQIWREPDADGEAQELMDHGHVMAVVRVLPGFGRDILRGDAAAVQIFIDGSNSNTAAIVGSYARRTVAFFAAGVLVRQQRAKTAGMAAGPAGMRLPFAEARSRVWFNPDLKSRVYFVPGIVVNIIALVTIMLTAMAIVREREIGTMEQLMVTPLRPVELMIGKTLPFALIGIFQVLFVTAGALLIFRVPLRGNPLELLLYSVLFLLTTLGCGLFISTISRTQQQAMMSTFFFFMPALLLSGFTFPIRNMPQAVQYFTYLNPLRYFMEIVRGIFLKGTGISILWPQVLALLVFGLTILGLSSLRFHKRLD